MSDPTWFHEAELTPKSVDISDKLTMYFCVKIINHMKHLVIKIFDHLGNTIVSNQKAFSKVNHDTIVLEMNRLANHTLKRLPRRLRNKIDAIYNRIESRAEKKTEKLEKKLSHLESVMEHVIEIGFSPA